MIVKRLFEVVNFVATTHPWVKRDAGAATPAKHSLSSIKIYDYLKMLWDSPP